MRSTFVAHKMVAENVRAVYCDSRPFGWKLSKGRRRRRRAEIARWRENGFTVAFHKPGGWRKELSV